MRARMRSKASLAEAVGRFATFDASVLTDIVLNPGRCIPAGIGTCPHGSGRLVTESLDQSPVPDEASASMMARPKLHPEVDDSESMSRSTIVPLGDPDRMRWDLTRVNAT